jgi:uncharacterized protein YmfQ (DUF2313 family)
MQNAKENIAPVTASQALELALVSPDALPPTRTLQEYSALRVGETWRREDHDLLVRRLAEIDELCVAVWKRLCALDGQVAGTGAEAVARSQQAQKSK